MSALPPRGIRNHNPGNIENNGTPWQGLAKPWEMTELQQLEDRFCVFKAPEWGIRAFARVLISYQDSWKEHLENHGYDTRTIAGIITRWAPETENNTKAYVASVCNAADLEPKQEIDVHRYSIAYPIIEAMIMHENGSQPYHRETIDKGLMLAGIEPPVRIPTPASSRTVARAGGAAASVVGAAVSTVPMVQDAVREASGYDGPLLYMFLAAAMIGIGGAVWAKIDDARKRRLA